MLKVAAGGWHSLVINADRSITFFGCNDHDRAPHAGLPGAFVDASAGASCSIMARPNGHIDCIGNNHYGCVPPGGVAGDFVSASAGGAICVAVTKVGEIELWGRVGGQGQPPAGVIEGPFKAINAGTYHTVALDFDGRGRHAALSRVEREGRATAPSDPALRTSDHARASPRRALTLLIAR